MIENTLSKVVYVADGIQRQWDIPFEFYKLEDVHIYLTTDGEKIEEITQNYFYDEQHDCFIYPTEESELPPVDAGTQILLLRETENTQLEDSSEIYFKSKDIERGLDNLTMQVQDLRRDAYRAVKVSHFSQQSPEEFANAIFEAEKNATEAAAKASLSEQNAASSESSAVQASATATASAELAQNAMDSSLENAERAENAAANAIAYSDIAKESATKAEDLVNQIGESIYTKEQIDDKITVINVGIAAQADAIQKTRADFIESDSELQQQINAHANELTTLRNDSDDLGDQVAEIESKIPAAASYSNQLADKKYVNEAILASGGGGGGPIDLTNKVDKSGDTMEGPLNLPELNVQTDEGTLNLSITAGVATIATNNGLDIVSNTKFDIAPTTDDNTTWENALDTSLVRKAQVATAIFNEEMDIRADMNEMDSQLQTQINALADAIQGGGGGSVVIETEITEDSTDTTVPSSKAVWDKVNVLEDRFVEGNPDYVVEGTGNLATIGNRAFTKKNDGLAYGMVYSNGSYIGCILVSEIPEAVVINPPSYAAEGSFEYEGRTWYYSPDEYFMPSSTNITLGLLKVIKTDTPFSTPLEAARYVIENGLNYKVNGLVTDVTNVKEDVSKLANAYTSSNLKAGTNIALTKTGYHKILSNFSSSKYIKFLKKFNPTSTYKMIVGLTTGSDVKTTQSILSVQGVDRNFYLKGSGSVFSYYHGSSVAGSTVATANTAYWLVFDYDGATCKLYLAKDDGTYVSPKDLPALTDSFWTEELSSTIEIFKGKNLQLGKNGSTSAYWFGSINLGKVLITADGDEWFNGLTAEEGIDYTNLGCTVTNERVEGLEVATTIDCLITKTSQLENDSGFLTSAEGAGASFPLFYHTFADHILNDASWLRGDTFSWQSGDMYVSAYNHLVADLEGITAEAETVGSTEITFYRAEDGHKIVLADQESNVSAIFAETGVAWYYILDTENKRFKLPRTKWAFTGLRNAVGNFVEAGLPNITGTMQQYGNRGGIGSVDGAFYGEGTTGIADASGQVSGPLIIKFDPSRSSEVYGKSETVQPNATEQYLYFYVGNTVRNQTEIDIGALTEEVNKIHDYVTESYNDGNGNWWEKYKSGKVRQGGLITYSQERDARKQVTLLLPMKDTNYFCSVTGRSIYRSDTDLFAFNTAVGNITTTGFLAHIYGLSEYDFSDGMFWIAEGKGAE